MECKCDINKHNTLIQMEKNIKTVCHYKTMRIRFRRRTVNVRKMSIKNNYYSDSSNTSKSIDVIIIMIIIILYFLIMTVKNQYEVGKAEETN